MWATFNNFEINMTKRQAESASHSGDCLPGVIDILSLPSIKKQLANIQDDKLKNELKEYGAWSEEELNDRRNNEERIIWIAAGNIVDNK
jgi:hypothetical protein